MVTHTNLSELPTSSAPSAMSGSSGSSQPPSIEPFVRVDICGGVFICTICRFAVVPTSVERHIADNHRYIKDKKRARTVRRIVNAGVPIQTADDLKRLRLPETPVRYIPELGEPCRGGIRCRECPYIVNARSKNKMQAHCRDKHNWVNPNAGGGRPSAAQHARPASGDRDPWVSGVYYQRLFVSRSGYFEVLPAPTGREREEDDSASSEASEDEGASGGLAALLRLPSPPAEAALGQGVIDDAEGRAEPNPWVARVGWATHLRGLDADMLRSTVSLKASEGWPDRAHVYTPPSGERGGRHSSPPSSSGLPSSRPKEGDVLPFFVSLEEAERMLSLAWDSLARVIYGARNSCSLDQVGLPVLFEIARRDVDCAPSRPFPPRLEPATMARYTNVWKCIVGYLFRTYAAPASARPPYCLTTRQVKAIELFRRLLAEEAYQVVSPTQQSTGDGGQVDSSAGDALDDAASSDSGVFLGYVTPSDDSEEDLAPEQCVGTTTQQHAAGARKKHPAKRPPADCPTPDGISLLDSACLELVMSLLDHELPAGSYDSVLLSALAVMGIKPRGGWYQPGQYTSNLAAVIKIARMATVFRAQVEIAREARRDASRRSRRRGPSHHDVIRLRLRYQRRPAWRAGDASDEEDDDEADGATSRGDSGSPGLFGRVRQYVHRFLTRVHQASVPCPMDWILNTFSYGLRIRYTTPAEPRCHWEGNTLHFDDKTLDLHMVSDMCHALVAELRALVEELTFTPVVAHCAVAALPELRMRSLADDPSNEDPEFCFLADARNASLLQPGVDWLAKRIDSDPATAAQWYRKRPGDGPDQLVSSRALEYLRRVKRFRRALLVAIHLLAGQPARATELLGLRHFNTPYGGRRNIFIENGIVALLFTYHKGYHTTGQARVIYRYLPAELSEVLVRYLWLVLPFAQRLERALGPAFGPAAQNPRVYLSPFLFDSRLVYPAADPDRALRGDPTGQLWPSATMRHALEEYSIRLMSGVKVNISDWRHIAIALARKHLVGDLAGDLAGHASDLVEKDAPIDDILDDPEVGDLVGGEGDLYVDLQAGHSTHVSHMIYARQVHQGKDGLGMQQDQYRTVSQAWHTVLGFHTDAPACAPVARAAVTVLTRHRQARLDRLRRANLTARLTHMLGRQDARFRGNQQAALEAVAQGHSPILQVAGTGGGKSLTFMLPAFCLPRRNYGGSTVVIVPFVALQQDLARRCEAYNIHCAIWTSPEQTCDASLILVTPESFCEAGFCQFLNKLVCQSRLDRIVYDECHTVLGASDSFRPTLLTLGSRLARTGTQLVFLTATLPPRDEAAFFDTMRIDPTGLKVLRYPTTRRNIFYKVSLVDTPDHMLPEVKRYLALAYMSAAGDPRDWLGRQHTTPGPGPGAPRHASSSSGFPFSSSSAAAPHHASDTSDPARGSEPLPSCTPASFRSSQAGPRGPDASQDFRGHLPAGRQPPKVIIYCRSKVAANFLAHTLQCPQYHAGMDGPARVEAVERWRADGGPIAATTALGAGIDLPDVVMVVHYDMPYSLVEFAQESGRAGRSGQPAVSLVVTPRLSASRSRARAPHRGRRGGAESTARKLAQHGWDREDITEYIDGAVWCRRLILDRVLDGRRDRLGCEEGETPCDLCFDRAEQQAIADVAGVPETSPPPRQAGEAAPAAAGGDDAAARPPAPIPAEPAPPPKGPQRASNRGGASPCPAQLVVALPPSSQLNCAREEFQFIGEDDLAQEDLPRAPAPKASALPRAPPKKNELGGKRARRPAVRELLQGARSKMHKRRSQHTGGRSESQDGRIEQWDHPSDSEIEDSIEVEGDGTPAEPGGTPEPTPGMQYGSDEEEDDLDGFVVPDEDDVVFATDEAEEVWEERGSCASSLEQQEEQQVQQEAEEEEAEEEEDEEEQATPGISRTPSPQLPRLPSPPPRPPVRSHPPAYPHPGTQQRPTHPPTPRLPRQAPEAAEHPQRHRAQPRPAPTRTALPTSAQRPGPVTPVRPSSVRPSARVPASTSSHLGSFTTPPPARHRHRVVGAALSSDAPSSSVRSSSPAAALRYLQSGRLQPLLPPETPEEAEAESWNTRMDFQSARVLLAKQQALAQVAHFKELIGLFPAVKNKYGRCYPCALQSVLASGDAPGWYQPHNHCHGNFCPWPGLSEGETRRCFQRLEAAATQLRERCNSPRTKLALYSGCFMCWAPQRMCDRFRPKANDPTSFTPLKDGYCRYPPNLVRLAVARFCPLDDDYESLPGDLPREQLERLFQEAASIVRANESTCAVSTGSRVTLDDVIRLCCTRVKWAGKLETNGACVLWFVCTRALRASSSDRSSSPA